jgi:hypothetical protein
MKTNHEEKKDLKHTCTPKDTSSKVKYMAQAKMRLLMIGQPP